MLYEGLFHEDVEVAKIHVIISNKFAVNKTGFSFPWNNFYVNLLNFVNSVPGQSLVTEYHNHAGENKSECLRGKIYFSTEN